MTDDMSRPRGRVIIYGAGGLGRETLVLARHVWGDECIIGFADDGAEKGSVINDARVLGGMEYFDKLREPVSVLIAIASPSVKEKIYSRLSSNSLISFPSIVHPTCILEPYGSIDDGVIFARNNYVSIDTKIGRCVLLNGSAAVGHDTVIGDFSTIMPMAAISGNVTIGKGCLIGASSAILQGVSIGDGATVAMGAIVLRDVPPGATVMGNPAKRIS